MSGDVLRVSRLGVGLGALRGWPLKRWTVAAVVCLAAALVIGVPTGIVSTGFYTRMTPVVWWNYPVWAVSAVLVGLLAATYVRDGAPAPAAPDRGGRAVGGTLLTTFAVGCPVCNKLVVALIGASGATSYWAPLQPVLGLASVALLLAGLSLRLRGQLACPAPGIGAHAT